MPSSCSPTIKTSQTTRPIVQEKAEERAILGPEPLHADRAVAVANNYLDTAGYADYGRG